MEPQLAAVKNKLVYQGRSLFLPIIFSLIFLPACQKKLIKKDEIEYINEYYRNKIYYLKSDLQVSSKETIKKGTKVKIWIEPTPSILKVKCYPVDQERETALGKMVTYIVNDELKGVKFDKFYLDAILDEKLSLEEIPQEKSKGKK